MNTVSNHAIESMRSICLDGIKKYSEWSANDGDNLARYSEMLAGLPDFETEAEWAIALAFAAQERNLKRIKKAFDQVAARRAAQPVIVESHTSDSFISEAAE